MNQFVKEQLQKCKVASLPPYSDDTMTMVIPKAAAAYRSVVLKNHCYLLQLEPYILNPPEGFSLHDNWNKGTKPLHEFVKAEICEVMGKMVKVNSVGFDYKTQTDTNDMWEGWLPMKSIKIVSEL